MLLNTFTYFALNTFAKVVKYECTVIEWLGIVWMFQFCAPEGFLSVVVQYF